MSTPPHRRTTIWVVVGGLVLAGSVAGTLVLSSGEDEPAPAREKGHDLSTPERAARSFAEAAVAGDGAELVELTCVAHPECVTRQGQLSPDQVDEAKGVILDGMDHLAAELGGAEFGEVSEASVPGAMAVEYRTPAMTDGQRHTLIFVEVDGDWLYVGSASAAT